jgi:hypothetical protein
MVGDGFREEETNKVPEIIYGTIKPRVDYRRVLTEENEATQVDVNYVFHKHASATWSTIFDCREIRDVTGFMQGNKLFNWTFRTYVAERGSENWLEAEFVPKPPHLEERKGFVVRLDLETGNPLEEGDNKQLVIKTWSRERIMGLRNNIARLTGREEVPTTPEVHNQLAEDIAANCWKLSPADFANYVVGNKIDLEHKANTGDGLTQFAAIATVISEMIRMGGSYNHQMEERWFGYVRSGFQARDGSFQTEKVEDCITKEITRAMALIRSEGEIMKDGKYQLVDTQGEVVELVVVGNGFGVQLLKRELGWDKDGHAVRVTENYPDGTSERLVRAAKYGLSSSRGYHGSEEDRAYVAERYLFRLNRG